MMKSIVVAVLAVFALGSCSKPAANAATAAASPAASIPATASVAAAPPATPPATMADWTAALEKLYTSSSTKDEGDGVTSFFSNFGIPGQSKGEAHLVAFGKRDTFRNLRFYTPGIQLEIETSLEDYISLRDGKLPALLIKPYFFGENGWLFINQVAVMADGEIVFQRDFKDEHVDTDILPGGVQERYTFLATPEDIAGLRKIRPDSKVLIRITGKKGYVMVNKREASAFRANIIDSLQIYDLMTAALKPHLPPG
ncbi:hypothetical protein AB4Y45_33775 [Paraburkholderia sp. EG287A]|uniref:hypothetical protein n=1 Tax=Paraburkholderia sp. EG287A TaxID=3237012 RepID=UPI0034D23DE8